jgi:hypothetical protein
MHGKALLLARRAYKLSIISGISAFSGNAPTTAKMRLRLAQIPIQINERQIKT